MIKILQIGEGVFLRAFAEDYIETLNRKGLYDGKAAVCQPRSNTKVIHALRRQNCVYRICIRGRFNHEYIYDIKKINAIERVIDRKRQSELLKEIFVSDELEMVISNTTEAGICFDENDEFFNAEPVTFPAKVTVLLFYRYNEHKKGLVFLPVELIENNGDELKKCILKYAERWQLGEGFKAYVNNECHFCNTLVDRIVAGKTQLEELDDRCAVVCEPYSSWLIEADEEAKAVIPFTKAGMGAEFKDDIKPYRERKVKILNGVHTMTALAAYSAGIRIVRDMVTAPLFAAYINKGLNEEILKTIDLPEDELESYKNEVLERFNNPFIDHELYAISLNSVSKFKERCLWTYADYYNKFGKTPDVLSFSLAALINFYEAPDEKEYKIRDIPEVLDFFRAEHEDIVADVMKNESFWGRDITKMDGAYEKVKKYFDDIKENGIINAVEKLVNE